MIEQDFKSRYCIYVYTWFTCAYIRLNIPGRYDIPNDLEFGFGQDYY